MGPLFFYLFEEFSGDFLEGFATFGDPSLYVAVFYPGLDNPFFHFHAGVVRVPRGVNFNAINDDEGVSSMVIYPHVRLLFRFVYFVLHGFDLNAGLFLRFVYLSFYFLRLSSHLNFRFFQFRFNLFDPGFQLTPRFFFFLLRFLRLFFYLLFRLEDFLPYLFLGFS